VVKKSIQKITVVLKPHLISEFSAVLPNLCTWFSRRKVSVQFLSKDQDRLKQVFKTIPKNVSFVDEDKYHNFSDLILSLGGDGTLIGVCRQSTKHSPPIFGVNMGRLGFITEFSKAEFFDELDEVINGRMEIVKAQLYKIEVQEQGKVIESSFFLNDAVFNKNHISRMIWLTVENDYEHIYDLSGDGLIISSPIGSTAYSLAAGGPIIHPQVGSLVMTPISPHSLTHRPIVIPDNMAIHVKSQDKDDPINLTLDGQQLLTIYPYQTVKVSKSKARYVQLVHNPARTFFHTLKVKFTHGRREA
tara:strand:- start:4364 stop:5269 length:906 start_codon:yes stop_codon:yes gene_type:complete